MSGGKNVPIAALYDQPDALSAMLGSFDLDEYDARDAVELKDLLAVVDRQPSCSGTGAAPAAANDQVRRGRSLPRPTGSGSCAGASQGLVTTDHILRGTSASVFFAPLPVDAAASVKREPFGSGSASLATAAQDTQTRLDSQSVSPTGNPRFSEKNMSKADRVREKNRLAQARFRQKQREEVQALERHFALTHQKIEDTKRKCINFQKAKHVISSRISKAGAVLVALEQCSSDMEIPPCPSTTTDTLGYPSKAALSHAVSAPVSVAASTTSLKAKHPLLSAVSAPKCSTVVPLVGRFGSGSGKSRKSVESFAHCASISMDCVSVYTEQPFSFGSQVQSYKNEQAQKLGAHPKEVCWFIQQPFELHNGQLLSLSSCLGLNKCKNTCSLGIVLYFVANFFKASQFDRELRLYDEGLMEGIEDVDTSTSKQTRSGDSSMEGSGNVGGESQKKRSRAASYADAVTCSLAERPLVDTNDPILATLTMRCGINDECMLADAVKHVIGALLKEHRERMPRDVWLDCCQEFLRFIDQLAGRSPEDTSASASSAHAESAAPEELQFLEEHSMQGFAKACALMFQILVETVLNFISTDPENRQWEPSEHRRKQASELAEKNIKSWGFTWCMLLMDAPRTAREMAVDFCGPAHRSFEHVEETHLKMYKSMRLGTEQRRHLASLWREWQRRRRALDKDHDSAMSKLESLPAADDINDSFILLVSALCSGYKTAVATAATALDLPFDNVLDKGRTTHQFLGISPDATATGTEAIRILQEASERDNRVQMDVYALWMLPHMTTKQKLRFFATIVDTQVGAMEVLSVLQTAAFQQRRDELYSSQAVSQVDPSGHRF